MNKQTEALTMPTQRWEISDTATGETDYWDLVRPLGQSASLEEAAANINDSVIAACGEDECDPDCWETWGFVVQEWDAQALVLRAYSHGASYWGEGHVLTATLVKHQPVNPEEA